MEPTRAKPTRKRRRWLIVAFVLVLVSAVSWWYWPRGDARFVGKWSALMEGDAGPYGEIVFLRNGQSHFYPTGYVDAQGGPWRVKHNRLIMSGKAWPDWGVFQPVVIRLEAWMGIDFMVNVDLEPLEIQAVTPDEIRLKNTKEGRSYLFRRIAE
jgi:hypothetical protein